ncbi:hypothetical protein DRO26_03040 [Candidatus Bathyarchaeota archaeon]|nr:MAG: hypothetical protein DRO26_03040 [Candidatus Bathyarchaeota archaeon]
MRWVGKPVDAVTVGDVRSFLGLCVDRPYRYRNHLAGLKVFFRDSLGKPWLVESFRFPRKIVKVRNSLPDKVMLKRFFGGADKFKVMLFS